MAFQHVQRLNEKMHEIRMLTIMPSDDQTSSVQCELSTVSLVDYTTAYGSYIANSHILTPQKTLTSWVALQPLPHPSIGDNKMPQSARYNWGDFAALSYTWGSPDDTVDVFVNRKPIKVTTNLAAALKTFRHKGYFVPGGMKLWIDALCINQSDFVERGQEVKRMEQIYGSAWTVVAWLGLEEHRSDKALELLEKMAFYYGRESEGEKLVGLLAENPDYLGSGVWVPLYEFVERPYWARLWILQEVVLAAMDVMMICGTSKIMWSVVRNGINMIGKYLYATKNGLLDRERAEMGWEPMHTWDSLNFHHISKSIGGLTVNRIEGGGELSAEKLLEVADRSVSTNPRDKVYGLLGMLSKKVRAHIIPDYTLEPGAVFTTLAAAFIQENGNLEILRECRLWGNFERPSWVPDWTAGFHSREADLTRSYDAGSGMPPNFSFHADGTQFECSGFTFDRIDGLGASQYGYDWDWDPDTIIQPTNHISSYGGFEFDKKALYSSLIGDRDLSGNRASNAHEAILALPSDIDKAFENFERIGWSEMVLEGMYYHRWSNWVQANKTLRLNDRPLGDYFKEEVPQNADFKLLMGAYKRFGHTTLYRRFLTTENGYWGWAPDWQYVSVEALPRKGDLIVVLFGCSTPMILRKTEDKYQIIGEAYVQGVMEGEAFQLVEDGKRRVEEFMII